MDILFMIVVLVFSVVIHEVAHGAVANALGDPTARLQGRLTLNPMAHLDWFGSVLVPLVFFMTSGFAFGWAKPVPYNPYNLKNQRWGPALVAVAGPLSNMAVAVIFALAFWAAPDPVIKSYILGIIYINVTLAVFNLFPVPPLDGSQLLLSVLPARLERAWQQIISRYGMVWAILFIFLGWPLVGMVVRAVVSALVVKWW